MKELLDSVVMCNDIDVLKNVISIMSEYCYDVPCDRRKIDMIKSVKSELGVTNYDDELMRMHLALIGELKEADYAKDDYPIDNNYGININDWCVLWGEVCRKHSSVIHKWFPRISRIDYESRVKDLCIAFLEDGKRPFFDL